MNYIKISIYALVASAIIASCNKDEQIVAPTISNEALTTAQLQLVNTADASDKPTAQWEQLLDNNGNPQPVDVSQANLTLRANSTYTGKIVLLDKTQTPAQVISDEVKDRGNYHLFFYQPLPTTQALVIPNNPNDPDDVYPLPIPTPIPSGNPLNLAVTITDLDKNTTPLPIGLEAKYVTGAVSSGWMRVVLRHQPNTKNGTYAPGSTDLDVGFTVTVK